MPAAKWSTKPVEIKASADTAGAFTVTVPLYDGAARQGVLAFVMTAERSLRVDWKQDAGTTPVDFAAAWSNV